MFWLFFWRVAATDTGLKVSGQVLLMKVCPVPVEPAGNVRSQPLQSYESESSAISVDRCDVQGARSMVSFSASMFWLFFWRVAAIDTGLKVPGQVLLMKVYPDSVETAGNTRSQPLQSSESESSAFSVDRYDAPGSRSMVIPSASMFRSFLWRVAVIDTGLKVSGQVLLVVMYPAPSSVVPHEDKM